MCTSIVPKAQRWPVSPWFCDNLHPVCQYVSMNNFILYNTHLKAWYIHSVPHNLNLLISNYRLFRRPPSAPKITPLTKICFTWSRLHQKFAYLESKVPHLKFWVMRDRVYTPSGLKNKTVILHATTTTKVKTDHTKRPLLTCTLPPSAFSKIQQASGWGRGSRTLPTPLWQEQKGTGWRASAPWPGQNVSVC